MSAIGEVEKRTAEQPPAAEKAVKVKKTKAAPKEKKAKVTKTATHPPYFEMIKEALLALREKSGSSPHAIAKYMEENHKAVLPANFRKIMGLQLKNSAAKGKLIKVKASYKLSEAGKKDKAAAASKPAVKKAAAPTKKPAAVTRKPRTPKKSAIATAGTKRKAEAGKKVAKKATPAKPRQPKSIKSPAAKRARKASAA